MSYKVKEYIFISPTTNLFTKGRRYHLRRSKNGTKLLLTTDTDQELRISNGRISLTSDYNRLYLEKNFKYYDSMIYDSYKDFTQRAYYY